MVVTGVAGTGDLYTAGGSGMEEGSGMGGDLSGSGRYGNRGGVLIPIIIRTTHIIHTTRITHTIWNRKSLTNIFNQSLQERNRVIGIIAPTQGVIIHM